MTAPSGPTRSGPARTTPTRAAGWVPYTLLLLVLVPAVAGSLRLVGLAGGPILIPVDPRMAASPVPVAVHVVCAVAFAVLGAFQFSPGVRRRHPSWHRMAGRTAMVLGLAVALSGLWMTLFYARQPGTGELAYVFRLAAGTGMAASIVLGLTAIRGGEVGQHRIWMFRAYALALGAGTQVFTQGFSQAAFGVSVLGTDLALGAGWAINLAVAEYLVRRAGGGSWGGRAGWGGQGSGRAGKRSTSPMVAPARAS